MTPRKPTVVPTKVNFCIQGPTLRSIRRAGDSILGPGEGNNLGVGTVAHALILWALENVPVDIMREILVKSKAARDLHHEILQRRKKGLNIEERMTQL